MKRIITSMKILSEKTIAKCAKPRSRKIKYELASRTKVKKLEPQHVRELMMAIATVLKESKDLFTDALITDESYLSDFFYRYTKTEQKAYAKKLSTILGVRVNAEDSLVEIIKRL